MVAELDQRATDFWANSSQDSQHIFAPRQK